MYLAAMNEQKRISETMKNPNHIISPEVEVGVDILCSTIGYCTQRACMHVNMHIGTIFKLQ